jgi:hypothetical protein
MKNMSGVAKANLSVIESGEVVFDASGLLGIEFFARGEIGIGAGASFGSEISLTGSMGAGGTIGARVKINEEGLLYKYYSELGGSWMFDTFGMSIYKLFK